MGKLVKVCIILIFLVAVVTLALLNLYYTAGSYRALIYYENTSKGYALKGVEIYAKPIRASGYYQIELIYSKAYYSKILRPFSPLGQKQFLGVVDFNPSRVKIKWQTSSNSISYYLHVYAEENILLKPNVKVRKYICLNDCLIAEEPIKFKLILSPIEGGWVVNVDDVEVVVASKTGEV